MPSMFDGTAEHRFLSAVAEAAVDRGTVGHSVVLPRGQLQVAATFNVPNRVSIIGVNKRGTMITAAPGFTGDYLATSVNGTASMFDNALERLTLNCNHLAGGIRADAWQEGGGLRNVLIEKFTTNGVYIRNGFGGASTCVINDCELMSSANVAADCGIYIEEVSLVGNFLVHVTNSTISGATGAVMDYGIYVENDSLVCQVVHFEDVTNGIYLDGVGHHVLTGVSGANTVGTVVRIASTFLGTLEMRGCFRGGATNLLVDERAGPGALGTITYDTDVFIRQEPQLGIGAIVAGGSFDGSLTAPTTEATFGITNIDRTSTGDYYLTLARTGLVGSNFTMIASSNFPGGTVQCFIAGADFIRLISRNAAAAAADANEIKFLVVRTS